MNRCWIVVCFIIAAACGPGSIASAQFLEYQVDDSSYAVVVPEDHISEEEAKSLAYKRAAQIAVKKGYRYFSIESEGEVQVLQSNKRLSAYPSNLYHDLIIEGNNSPPQPELSSPPINMAGYRLVFQLQEEGSSQGTVDACTLTECH